MMLWRRPHPAPTRSPRIAALLPGVLAALLAAAPPVHAADAAQVEPGRPPAAALVELEIRLASEQPREGWTAATHTGSGRTIYLSPRLELSNQHIERAWLETCGDRPCVGLRLTEDGALRLARLSRDHIGERVAFVLDGEVVADPRIAAEIRGGRALIHGNFSVEEARAVAAGLTPRDGGAAF
jgi:preprotein translocase subunit SecD